MIKKKEHLETLVGSINKLFNNAKSKGILNSKELFLLNIIGKILLNDYYDMSFDDQKKLLSLYYNMLNKYSKILCKSALKRNYIFSSYLDSLNIANNCYTYTKVEEILYWQENFTLSNVEIKALIDNQSYLINKPSDTYNNFEIGKDINYEDIGKIVFLAMESSDLNYEIKDALGNNIAHTFQVELVPQLNATLFISDNIYSHGSINFKIKKI